MDHNMINKQSHAFSYNSGNNCTHNRLNCTQKHVITYMNLQNKYPHTHKKTSFKENKTSNPSHTHTHTARQLTLFPLTVHLPVAGPSGGHFSARLQLLYQPQHSLVAEAESHAPSSVRVKASSSASVRDYLHVAAEGMDITCEAVVILGATDLEEELRKRGRRRWRKGNFVGTDENCEI